MNTLPRLITDPWPYCLYARMDRVEIDLRSMYGQMMAELYCVRLERTIVHRAQRHGPSLPSVTEER
jgi:hypothetical protein